MFYEKLHESSLKRTSLLCVGLDSDFEKLPTSIRKEKLPQYSFNKEIVDATYDLVNSFKINTAFYEARGEEGIRELKMTCDYIREKHPDSVLIIDAKRADIGNTNKGYVSFIFEYLGADAVTLHPYLGYEALETFLNYPDKGCIILCRTSNAGAHEFQDLSISGKPLYQIVAENVVQKWNKNKNCALVVGATYPEDIIKVRKIAADLPLLIPGIGSQGGNLEKTVKASVDKEGFGAIIHCARSIIFTENPRKEARKMRDEINSFRPKKSYG